MEDTRDAARPAAERRLDSATVVSAQDILYKSQIILWMQLNITFIYFTNAIYASQ
jgi:hypothetical protein